MTKANVHEVKARLSEYLERASRGEHIVICRHNKPVAELRAIAEVRTDPRPIGPLAGRPTFDVPASFFEPMADDELAAWEGVTSTDPLSPAWAPPTARKPARVAEPKGSFSTRRGRRPGGRKA